MSEEVLRFMKEQAGGVSQRQLSASKNACPSTGACHSFSRQPRNVKNIGRRRKGERKRKEGFFLSLSCHLRNSNSSVIGPVEKERTRGKKGKNRAPACYSFLRALSTGRARSEPQSEGQGRRGEGKNKDVRQQLHSQSFLSPILAYSNRGGGEERERGKKRSCFFFHLFLLHSLAVQARPLFFQNKGGGRKGEKGKGKKAV